MKIDLETRNAYTEVIAIVDTLPDIDRSKIPEKLLNVIRENSNADYNFKFDILVSMNAWKLSEKAKLILAVLFRDYLATETQQQKIKRVEKNQIQKLEEVARQKYNPDNIFKKKVVEKEENIQMIEYKRNIFQRIWDKIRRR